MAMKNSEYLSAYKEGHSYETVLIKILNDLLRAMENQKISALVLLDLSSAFDTLDHDILLQVLDKKNALQWFDRYLGRRWFTVCSNGTYSSKKEISLSLPQGSINGPVLFNSYSSTIRSVIDESIKINV